MNRIFYTSLLIVVFSSCIYAQKYDFNWLLGTGPSKGDLLNFENYELKITPVNNNTPLSATNTTMSTIEGNLAFTFNGIKIQNANQQLMDGTDSLKLGSIPALFGTFGGAINQASLALPIPSQPNLLKLFYVDQLDYKAIIDTPYIAPYHVYMAIIDISQNNGLGKVIEKNIVVLSDTLSNSPLSAVKHANGRDWWVVAPEIVSNRYHILLITEQGVDTSFTMSIGAFWPPSADLATQSFFTNNGKKFIRFKDHVGLQLFDFDRCSGLFYNPQLIPFDFEEGYFSGASSSYDARFVYVTDVNKLHQYDLEADDILASKVLIDVYDGFTNPYDCNFLFGQLAPDGKIYINSWGGCLNLSVIDHPERKGQDCGFRQHGISLNYFTFEGLPNMPNYRLGPIDDSACDSLGIDNHPIAAFRYDVDSIGNWEVDFTDLSYYEPTTWSWTFGDGLTSNEKYPTHTYVNAGVYQVCLTVSNQNGSNTYCKTLFLGVTGLNENKEKSKIYFDLNSSILINNNEDIQEITIYSNSGKSIYQTKSNDTYKIDLNFLVSGNYIWKAIDKNGKGISGSFIKI